MEVGQLFDINQSIIIADNQLKVDGEELASGHRR